nr:glycoside hydrolase family 3 N-terminal domain-containing protein [Spirochaeta isovalerica]
MIKNGARYINDQLELSPLDEVKFNNNLQGLAERTEFGIPVIISSDPLHSGFNGDDMWPSRLSKWPFYLGLGAADDLKTTKAFGQTVADEMRMSGHHMLLGPQADIATEPRWGRIQHLLHANGDAAAKHMSVLIKAMQGGSTLDPEAMATTVKHIPGSGSVVEGMDSHTAAGQWSVFPGNNLDEHLKPFQAAIDAGATSVMACYSIIDVEEYKDVIDGKPVDEGAAFSTKIMTDLLRDEMGFDGSVVSDWGIAKSSAWGHMDIQEKPEIFAEMFNAGTYQYGGTDYTENWREAFELGLISQEKIDEGARKSLELQFKLGLFENPYVDLDEAEKFWDPEGDELRSRYAAGEAAMKKAMVLTENKDVAENLAMLPVLGTSDEYISSVDRNGNGVVDVYFDSVYPEADSGQSRTKAFSTETQYLNINFVDSPEKADLYIARMFSRGATYFGTQGGTPLSFDGPVMVWDHDKQAYTDKAVKVNSHFSEGFAEFGAWKFNDWSQVGGESGFIGQGFHTYLGGLESKAVVDKALAAKEAYPGMKVIIGMTASRPGIVTDFHDKVDAMIIDFAATDKAFLDIIFWQNGNKPQGRLPVEFPRDDASVEAQLEDVPGDTANPVYEIGYGLNYASMGGYGG